MDINKKITLCIFILTLVSGCASNPYIQNMRPVADKKIIYSQKQGSLGYSLKFAENQSDAYLQKFIDDFDQEQYIANSLIGIATTILGLAAFGANTDTITAAGLVGGGAYTLGTWNRSKNRLDIYKEGMKAIMCARKAIAPLNFSDEQINDIRSNLDTLEINVNTTANAVGAVTEGLVLAKMVLAGNQTEYITTAEKELSEMNTILQSANQLQGSANLMLDKVDKADGILVDKITEINNDINHAIKDTVADLNNLPKHITNISSFANVLAPGLNLNNQLENALGSDGISKTVSGGTESLLAGEEGSEAKIKFEIQKQLAEALNSLRASRIKLQSSMSQIQPIIDSVSFKNVQADLEGENCRVDPEKVKGLTNLSLTPNEITVIAGKADDFEIDITGGTPGYYAKFVQSSSNIKGINFRLPERSESLIVIANNETEAGSVYKLKVYDSAKTKHTVILTIHVKPQSTENKTTDTEDVCKYKHLNLNDFEKSLKKDEICLIQHVIGAKVDGVIGENTCNQFTNWAINKGHIVASSNKIKDLNLAWFDKIKSEKNIPTGKPLGQHITEINQKKLGCPDSSPEVPVNETTHSCIVKGAEKTIKTECQLALSTLESFQKKLKAFGLDEPEKDELGPKTRAAIEKFQNSEGLNGSKKGYIDSETFLKLKELN